MHFWTVVYRATEWVEQVFGRENTPTMDTPITCEDGGEYIHTASGQ